MVLPLAQVTVAVLSAYESQRLFGVPLARRSIQPVFLWIVNRHSTPLRLYLLDVAWFRGRATRYGGWM